MSRKLSKSFYDQIRYLLQKDHIPRITIGKSQITDNAGDGVFYVSSSSSSSSSSSTSSTSSTSSLTSSSTAARNIQETKINNTASTPTVLCLYPGIYTPGLPLTAIINNNIDNDTIIYLSNQFLPPSNVPYDNNAYIVNITEVGGYIDGLAFDITQSTTKPATTSSFVSSNRSSSQNQCIDQHYHASNSEIVQNRLDENPSACGHKVNHSSLNANTIIVPFLWKDVFVQGTSTTNDIDIHNMTENYDTMDTKEKYFPLPNMMRNDNSPWYYDSTENKMYCFTNTTVLQPVPLCGAAIVQRDDTICLQNNQELLLDYGLKLPLPSWAMAWYTN